MLLICHEIGTGEAFIAKHQETCFQGQTTVLDMLDGTQRARPAAKPQKYRTSGYVPK